MRFLGGWDHLRRQEARTASNDGGIDDIRAEHRGTGAGEGDDLPRSHDAPRLHRLR
jgi:hypothetical protein